MRVLLPVALAVALFAGCDTPVMEDVPWATFDPFARPETYTVVEGDTLGEIATDYAVTVEELKAWNGLDSDVIQVDQVLVIWPGDAPAATAAPVVASRSSRSKPNTLVMAVAVVDARPPSVIKRERPTMVKEAGVLAALDSDIGLSDEFDPELSAAADRLDDHRSRGGTSSALAHRSGSLASGGSAEMTSIDRPSGVPIQRASGWGTPSTVKAPRLRKPSPKRCLAGPRDVQGDYGMAAGTGLTVDQIGRSLDGFIRHTAACIPSGSAGSVTITTEMTVGCDGRVISTRVHSTGGAPSEVASCVAETLAYASFPAHDLPEMTFLYPLSLRF